MTVHELALCRSINAVVSRAAAGRRIAAVNLDVGALRQVVPATLVRCWRIVTQNTSLAGADLVVNAISAVLDCRECHERTVVADLPFIMCGTCGSTEVTVLAGEEFMVRSIDVEGVSDG